MPDQLSHKEAIIPKAKRTKAMVPKVLSWVGRVATRDRDWGWRRLDLGDWDLGIFVLQSPRRLRIRGKRAANRSVGTAGSGHSDNSGNPAWLPCGHVRECSQSHPAPCPTLQTRSEARALCRLGNAPSFWLNS